MTRSLALLTLVVFGCTKERQLVSIDGVSVTVPGDFIPMDERRVEALREAARSADPDVDVSMVGRRPASSPMPWMYVQRTALRPLFEGRLPVEKVLEMSKSELLTTLTEGGFETVSATSNRVGDTLDTCLVTKAKVNAKSLNHTCVRLWVGAKTHKVHAVSVVCVSMLDDEEECKRILATRTVTPTSPLPMDASLEP